MNRKKVSECALIARINRRLASESWPLRQLRTSREARMEQNVGRHYILNTYSNAVVEIEVDLEDLGRTLGALSSVEDLA
jgi:hypothetical protein